MRIAYLAVAIALLTPVLLTGCGTTQSSFTTNKAKVLKVYTVTDGQFRNVSYVVDRNGTEITVQDPLARSHNQVGDTITYLDQKIQVGSSRSFTFTLVDTPGAAQPGGVPLPTPTP